MEKLCIFCEHLEWLNERAMGSSWTGEYGTSGFICKKSHFDAYGKGEDRSFHDINDVRGLFLTAENCPDYEPPNVEHDRRPAALSPASVLSDVLAVFESRRW